jgi:SAM-dependent methyltransferase
MPWISLRAIFVAMMASLAVVTTSCTHPPSTNEASSVSPATSALRKDASAVAPLMKQPAALEFLKAATTLTPQFTRIVYTNASDRRSLSPTQYEALKPEERAGFQRVEHDENFYFSTYYGSPIAYARAIDIAGANGIITLNNARVLDIGYGAIGGPRLMAGAGARVTGVDVDSLLPALYRERTDQGGVAGFDGRTGSVTLHDGVFAGNATLTKLIGNEFNLIVTKNTMKAGFMKPAGGGVPLVSFEANDEVLLDTIYDALAPGGLFVIYNITAAPDPAKPSTDGRSPFTREQFTRANLKVIALDVNDDVATRAMGKALGWDKQMGDLEKNLFALYTVVQRAR